jgi:4-phospho-D-threonate 3-dehydrogenase / 4-phospho-D-erythronate 3-dehydrogenase
VAVHEPDRPAPIVAITMGDAAGIGPEVIVKALALHPDVFELCRPLVVGDAGFLEYTAQRLEVAAVVQRMDEPEDAGFVPGTIDCISLDCIPVDFEPGRLSAVAGEGAYRFVERAVALAMARRVDAICTAPLNKAALHMAGHKYPGHTELLADLTGTRDVVMMLSTKVPGAANVQGAASAQGATKAEGATKAQGAGMLRVAHVTTHVGLIDAVQLIDAPRVRRVVELAATALQGAVGGRPVHVGVCGVNPHAGEGGLFGRGEEEEKIVPAIEALQAEGFLVEGPLPADTAFFRASRGDFDVVVAMYHDQGHGPVKVLGLEGGVNITLGLPIVRTSVDHGTAFDIAGRGIADERSLISAVEEAARLSSAPAGDRA